MLSGHPGRKEDLAMLTTPRLTFPRLGRALVLLGASLMAATAPPAQAQVEPQSQARPQPDWTPCAAEGEVCRFNGEALVRFGTEGRYSFRMARDQVMCDTGQFGDPAPGQGKQCQVSPNWRGDARFQGWGDRDRTAGGGWRFCAAEGDECWVGGSARVRYGANGRYAVREVRQSVLCSNRVFGDPAPGVAKQCDFSTGTVTGPGPGPGRPTGVGLPWERCAREGDTCRFRGAALVRYGASGRYAYREAANGLACSNDSFGTDPAPGETKRCELLRVTR